MGMDFDKLAAQAMKMQEELQRVQEEAAKEQVTASAGGGTVKVTATAGGEIVKIEIDPKAIDPDDPELLADVVTAAVNQALRDGRALLESKVSGLIPGGLEGLGLGILPGM
jgi:DNA-binding YbaB/EbfC family protein